MINSIKARVQDILRLSLRHDPACHRMKHNLYRDVLEHIKRSSDDPVTRMEAKAALQAEDAVWEDS